MGRLHDGVNKIDDVIAARGLDAAETKGLIGMKAGFFLVVITPSTPDDPAQIKSLKDAAEEVLGESVTF